MKDGGKKLRMRGLDPLGSGEPLKGRGVFKFDTLAALWELGEGLCGLWGHAPSPCTPFSEPEFLKGPVAVAVHNFLACLF